MAPQAAWSLGLRKTFTQGRGRAFVPVVPVVLILFYIYIYIYLGITRVLAYCSFVLFRPPENDEGENGFCQVLSNKFFCNCSPSRIFSSPVILKNTEQRNNWNKTLYNPPQPAPTLDPPKSPRIRYRTNGRTIRKIRTYANNRVTMTTSH